MTTTFVFHNGALHPTEPDKLAHFKAKLSDGQAVTAEFSVDRHHSERAFRMLHALIRDLSRGLGIDYAAMKDQVCCQWGVAVPLAEAMRSIPEWPGHIVQPWDNGETWIRKSTTAYTAEEMSALIAGAQMMALENDVEIGA